MKRKTALLFITVGFVFMAFALGLTVYNLWDSNRAGEVSDKVLSSLNKKLGEVDTTFPTDNPDRQMPSFEIDGYRYIGKLSIPALDIEVPVMDTWDYERLQISPCLYSGSLYKDNMVIAAHNYSTHFGNIKSLKPDSKVIFTDAENNTYTYKVIGIETLSPTQVEELKQPTEKNPWSLTLFTCTYDGSQRYTVRCTK